MSEGAGTPDLSVESLMAEVAEEFVERLHRGEQPDVEEYTRRYPPLPPSSARCCRPCG
jgi:hypothetical protein